MKPVRILFVIENAHYPQDTRVYNECTSLSKLFDCYVLAPKAKGQSVVERVEAATCYRYPAFDGTSIKWIPLEYLISLFWIALLVPIVALAKRIRVVHVANPPDMIIPMIAWLKLLGTRIVFDAHDISTETLKGKMSTERSSLSLLLPLLEQFESLSIRVADLAIATNESILTRIRQKSADKRTWIVRNGNATVYASVDKVNKPPANGAIRLGYFGVLANDRAAGLDNIITVARVLANRGVPFSFSIVGNGHGLPRLKQMIDAADMTDRFEFHGFVPIPQAYQIIKSFDFGFVSWGRHPQEQPAHRDEGHGLHVLRRSRVLPGVEGANQIDQRHRYPWVDVRRSRGEAHPHARGPDAVRGVEAADPGAIQHGAVLGTPGAESPCGPQRPELAGT